MKSLSAKSRIALGQIGLLVSVLLAAIFLGVVPDRDSAVREGRAALAEALAANSSILVRQADLRRLRADLRLVVERNADLLSAALRQANGKVVVTVGEHEQHWREMKGEHSTDVQVRVPIRAGSEKWGQLELRFMPMTPEGWLGVVNNPWVRLVTFIALASFVAFYFYLGKMLKHLDPSAAIPGRVRSALDTMAEGLLVVDAKQHIVLANQAFASIVGKAPDDLLGHRASEFRWVTSDGSILEKDAYPWVQALHDGVSQQNVMARLQLSDLEHRTFMVNASPVLGASGKPGGVLISLDDVTALEEKEIELRKSKEEAEAANRAKSDFLANMSHEIRTPMNAILGFTEILKRGYGRSQRDTAKHLNTIHSSGKHLLELINDILDLSKVEAGRLEVERVSCAPHAIIIELVRILGVKGREKGITVRFEPDGPIPESISSDPSRLRQIITNLVGNAIKFTDQGGVTIVTRLVESNPKTQLAIEVIDTGVGMREDKLDAIFDPFVQADSSVTRKFGGTGLGLAISRKFARALGGDITVSSKPGKGSVFTVTLDTGPLDGTRLLQPDEVLIEEDELSTGTEGHWEFPPARVLVVDDGDENRELVALVLEEVGINVEPAENGQIGVDKALAGSFDIVLMDVQMPVMDGYTATRTLREKGLQTPIIALTANAMKGFEEECLAAGFTAYMTKPIDIDGLIRMLADRLGGRRVEHAETAAPSPEPSAEESTGGEAAEAAAPIVSKLAASNPRFQSVVERFVKRLEEQLEAMEQAWKEREMNELAGLAHWLKGAGGTVGFDVFTEPAKNLEQLAKARSEDQIEESIAELRRLCKRLVSSDGEEVPRETTVPGQQSGCDTRSPVVSRLAADDPRFRPVVRKFVVRLEEQLQAMESAWKERNFETLAGLAHWLKGAGGTVGIEAFTEPAKSLEALAKARSENHTEEAIAELRRLAARIIVPGDEDLPKTAA